MSAERINLALGGGGAKGLVHVGALEGIHAAGFEIASITGTSVGSIVGSLFAYYRSRAAKGGSSALDAQNRAIDGVRAIIEQTVLVSFQDFSWDAIKRGQLLAGSRLGSWLDTALLERNKMRASTLADIDFPLSLTAAIAETGEGLIFSADNAACRDIPLPILVRASAAIPGVFPEVEVPLTTGTVRCWDGGVCGNCRFDLAGSKFPELRTFAVSVTYSGRRVRVDTSLLERARAFPRRLIYGLSPEVDHSMNILLKACEDNAFKILPDAARARIVRIFPDFGEVSTLDFDLSLFQKRDLFQRGRDSISQIVAGAR